MARVEQALTRLLMGECRQLCLLEELRLTNASVNVPRELTAQAEESVCAELEAYVNVQWAVFAPANDSLAP